MKKSKLKSPKRGNPREKSPGSRKKSTERKASIKPGTKDGKDSGDNNQEEGGRRNSSVQGALHNNVSTSSRIIFL